MGAKPIPTDSEKVFWAINVDSRSPIKNVEVSCDKKVVAISRMMMKAYRSPDFFLNDRTQNSASMWGLVPIPRTAKMKGTNLTGILELSRANEATIDMQILAWMAAIDRRTAEDRVMVLGSHPERMIYFQKDGTNPEYPRPGEYAHKEQTRASVPRLIREPTNRMERLRYPREENLDLAEGGNPIGWCFAGASSLVDDLLKRVSDSDRGVLISVSSIAKKSEGKLLFVKMGD